MISQFRKRFSAQRAERFRLMASAILGLLALAGALLWMAGRPTPAQAKSSYKDAFLNTYPAAANSKLANCSLCHTANIPALNPYGADYKRLGHNFAAIEVLDSDGDGVKNLAEITALTWPGDPTDLPGAPATATATTAPPTATPTPGGPPPPPAAGEYRLIGWNDLGMHCMNESFANLAVLPPYNTLWAQLIRQGPEPDIVTSGVTIEYSIIDNTYSVGKTDFWQHAKALFGVDLAPNIGLTGNGLAGSMHVATDHFVIEGVPLTPYRDSAPQPGPQNWYPYQLAHLVARDNATGAILAETTTVAPVSTEMRCDTCHGDGMQEGIRTGNVETNILTLHDKEEDTNLMGSRPVLCAACHGSNALGAPGKPGIPNLSRAMHKKHAPEGGAAVASPFLAATQALIDGADSATIPSAVTSEGTNNCYLCHPGQQTQCLRDVMYSKGMTCINCHGGTADVADPNRRPWIDEPRCETCHTAQYGEEPGKLYRNSVGHGGLYCEACHGSPHAILPSIEPNDNIQNIALQGHAGTLSDCTVCHATVPNGPGPHGIHPAVTPTATASPTATATSKMSTATPTATASPTATRKTSTATPTRTQERQQIDFKGLVQTRPTGRIGLWRIGDRDVAVDSSTRFDETKGPAVAGTLVEVVGYADSNGQILALRIKVENALATPVPTVKFIGAIQRLPATGLIGAWQVADRSVNVTASTQVLGNHARYVVGARVKVRGRQAADGSITATEIELYVED